MRIPSLNSLRVFYFVGKYLSFNIAGQKLNVTSGAISKQIKRLEDLLGTPLFVRGQQNIYLTPKGAKLHQELDTCFQIIDHAVANFDHFRSDTKLNILCAPTYANRWLIPKLMSFQQKNRKLNLTIHSQAENEFIYDAEIRFGDREKARFSSELLTKEIFVGVCAPDLLERSKNLESEIDHFLHIAYQGGRLPIWEKWLSGSNIEIETKDIKHLGIELYTLDQVITATKAGMGFAVVDYRMILQELKEGSLVMFHPDKVESDYGYWLDIHPDKVGLSKLIDLTGWLKEINNEIFSSEV